MHYSGDEYYSEDAAADMAPKKRVRKFYGTAPRNRYGAVGASGPQGGRKMEKEILLEALASAYRWANDPAVTEMVEMAEAAVHEGRFPAVKRLVQRALRIETSPQALNGLEEARFYLLH